MDPVQILTIRERLQQDVLAWEPLSMPATLQRFVLKHGQAFFGVKRPRGKRRRTAKQCFRNAALLTMERPSLYTYYEGYAMDNNIEFPFLHAWNVNIETNEVVDLTLRNPENYQYLGIEFSEEIVARELVKNQVYGLLDIGILNVPLLREIDDELVEKCFAIAHQQKAQSGRDVRPDQQDSH